MNKTSVSVDWGQSRVDWSMVGWWLVGGVVEIRDQRSPRGRTNNINNNGV